MSESALIIYDGDCIFCENYVMLVRLRDVVGKIDLIDARSDDPRIAYYQRLGYNLNEGMLFVWRGQIHHGADAVHVLGGLSSDAGWFNKLNRAVFSSRLASKLLYPFLKLGRRVTLALRGKSLISGP